MRGVQSDSEGSAELPKGCLRFGGLSLDLDSCTLTRESGETIPLTRGEFALLRALAGRPGRVVSRETLLGVFSNRTLEPFDRSVDALICRLRRKIEADPKAHRLIITVPGEGYRFDGLAKTFQLVPEPDDAPPSLDKGAGVATLPVTPAGPTPRKRRFELAPLAAALAALILVLAGGVWWFLNPNRPTTVGPEAARFSIVVMPFANLSGDPGQDHVIDALTDELSTNLARHNRFVIAHNTAVTFKGKPIDAKAIGKELGVRYVLAGSVEPIGDRMRVNAQLIDTGSAAHLWAEQFDTPRADLLQTQDAIVAHLANALDFQLHQADDARVKRTPAASRDAEDLALQCFAGGWKAGWIGKEADAAYALCEQALAIDPNNVRALMVLGVKFLMPARLGLSGDPKGDLKRADELESKALALDPDYAGAHDVKGTILRFQARTEEAVAEHERALDLDPSNAYTAAELGYDHHTLGEFDKSIEYLDKAILASPYDRALIYWHSIKAWDNFGLKRYDQAIEVARRSIAIKPDYNPYSHVALVAALALTDRNVEARDALQRYLALPSTGPLKTIATWTAHQMSVVPQQGGGDPRYLETNERMYDGLRKAGMPEE
jgi:adenylate cyclase